MLVAGLGGSFFHPAATAMVARLFPVNTGKALGLVGIGASVGFCLGPIYAGWRAEMAGWRIPVRELGLLGMLAAIVFYWLAEEEPAHRRAAANVPHHVEKMFPTPILWLLFIVASFAFSLRDFAGSSMVTLGSLFLQKARHLDPTATGLTLSGMFLLSAVSNPLFGGLSDNARMRWVTAVLVISAGIIALFPHVPRGWLMPMVLVYGFFFLSNYPMVEAAVMQAVPDSVRGRVFGLFITAGGLVGNLSHGLVGRWVNKMGDDAGSPAAYYGLYAGLAVLVMLSLLGLPCLHAIRKREQVALVPSVEVIEGAK
jgi:MFS family permease